jgi:hypothetical protein
VNVTDAANGTDAVLFDVLPLDCSYTGTSAQVRRLQAPCTMTCCDFWFPASGMWGEKLTCMLCAHRLILTLYAPDADRGSRPERRWLPGQLLGHC